MLLRMALHPSMVVENGSPPFEGVEVGTPPFESFAIMVRNQFIRVMKLRKLKVMVCGSYFVGGWSLGPYMDDGIR